MRNGIPLLLGLLLVFLLAFMCSCHVEEDVQAVAETTLADGGHNWASPEADGRIVAVTGLPPTAGAAIDATNSLEAQPAIEEAFWIDDTRQRIDPEAVATAAASCGDQIRGILQEAVIEFEFGSAQLSPSGQALLDRLAEVLQSCPYATVAIEAHTDNVGEPEANRVLSQGRSESVLSYLTAAGIADRRLTAMGFGDSRPVASNETDEGRARNRRVELNIQM